MKANYKKSSLRSYKGIAPFFLGHRKVLKSAQTILESWRRLGERPDDGTQFYCLINDWNRAPVDLPGPSE